MGPHDFRSLLQSGLPLGSQLSPSISLIQCEVLRGLQVELCYTMDLHGLLRDSLTHQGLKQNLKGNCCFGTWSTSSSFVTDHGVCRANIYYHSLGEITIAQQVFPLYSVIPQAPSLLQVGLAMVSSGSILELASIDLFGYGGGL